MKGKTLNTTVSKIKDTKGEFTLCNNGNTLTENYQDCYRVICQFENPNEPYARLIAAAPELFQMVRDLKNCIKRLTQDNLSQFERDTEAQWEGEAHDLLTRIAPNYYRNANE